MKTAHLDCFSGISGDMFVGALLDAGLPFEELKGRLSTLPLRGYEIDATRESRNGIFGTRFSVKIDHKLQAPRRLDEIREIISAGDLAGPVKEKSMRVFEHLAEAEAKAHDQPVDQVHLHEVGAADSIIDIVATVHGLHALGIEKLSSSPLPLGSGFVDTAHGRLPLPSPATVTLLLGFPVYDSGLPYEMVTPTGAALVKALAATHGPMPSMKIIDVAYGVGSRDLPDRPNLLRILIGDRKAAESVETIVVLETNVDDAPPEWLGFIMERLFEAGALDVAMCPIQMKKNRPGVQIQIMAPPECKDALMEILFRESFTLGIRFQYSQRAVLKRCVVEVDSPWGKIRVKQVTGKGGEVYFLPEYEVCREIARKENKPLKEIFSWVMSLNKVV